MNLQCYPSLCRFTLRGWDALLAGIFRGLLRVKIEGDIPLYTGDGRMAAHALDVIIYVGFFYLLFFC
jgi:hypothetical protein